MIFRRKPPAVELTNEAYGRWLRACCPQPIAWFLGLSDLEQTALADIGQAHIIELGTVAAQQQADEEEDEGDATLRLAQDFVQRLGGRAHAPVAQPAPSMGGITERREKREQDDQKVKDEGRALFGRKPDGVDPDRLKKAVAQLRKEGGDIKIRAAHAEDVTH